MSMRDAVCNASLLIDALIRAADDDAADTLDAGGFISPDESVDMMTTFEDTLAGLLDALREYAAGKIGGYDSLSLFVPAPVDKAAVRKADAEELDWLFKLLAGDDFDSKAEEAARAFYDEAIAKFGEDYLQAIDPELSLGGVFTDRTTAWMDDWAEQLARLMKLDTYSSLASILTNGLADGSSVATVVDQLKDAYCFSQERARRTAITEMLTAHSYAAHEAMIQSPAVESKMWQHTGTHKNKPRKHHQDMDGQTVKKNEKFIIYAPNGSYECDFPRDTTLPASERVNCHCNLQPVVSSDVLGLSLEERKRLQQEAIDADNGAWEAELDAANRAQAGIE